MHPTIAEAKAFIPVVREMIKTGQVFTHLPPEDYLYMLETFVSKPEWQSVDTAPKDGTCVLVVVERRRGTDSKMPPHKAVHLAYYDGDEEWLQAGSSEPLENQYFYISMWQPEPEIPHDSDCAVHNEPALPNGPCNCGVIFNRPKGD